MGLDIQFSFRHNPCRFQVRVPLLFLFESLEHNFGLMQRSLNFLQLLDFDQEARTGRGAATADSPGWIVHISVDGNGAKANLGMEGDRLGSLCVVAD